jgi:hypothetical protein
MNGKGTAAFATHKRTAEGKRITMARKARRLSKYVGRPLDVDSILSSLPRGLKVA